ncbi:lactosylceramide alpha-2,3-sialyltransferase [Periophthalmus magnuspinnatus]|uniref:lactosylceramide alpha-2,3-sialyltransferase n=1 Tax=Periophthalmus magnuspinnatus TaxID=409849 RepID=UPI002436F9B6|nr:lactosylceramide alpha-2,3-sialyltransferase [Periophthalmus magnuspinnatus]XP_055080700.1 lactosylceramide alpha-2,3-sialyltransferase [Periophthalmus magnuspinnatus]
MYSLKEKTRAKMRRAKHWVTNRRMLVLFLVLGLIGLAFVSLPLFDSLPPQPLEWHVDPTHRKLVHKHVQSVLDGECLQGQARQALLRLLPHSSKNARPFLWRDSSLPEELFLFPPPFGFKGLRDQFTDLTQLLPESSSQVQLDKCSRCVVVGNGGILRGLELGPLINQFDTIIRLNSGPLGEFVADVGNRTSIRMAYPESTPHLWADSDPRTLFVAVIYKAVDLNWVSAMIRKAAVPLWDRLFFWQKVPAQVPIESHRFRLLNPDVIRETALDLLKYPPPRSRLLGWDSNIPTLGVTAVTLASLLCDQVSLAGFGYNLSQLGWPLHYYDHLAMDAILQQKMHNINRESELLRSLVKTGTLSDLTGAIQRLYPS